MNNKLILLSILFLGAVLRFIYLSDVPPSLSHDEVAIGYNAWSILKTGRDEYGHKFPLLFQSFDDYKLPGMVYSTIPSLAIFGLNEIGVRFPSAFFGTTAIIVFYFLLKELLGNQTVGLSKKIKVEKAAIISVFFAFSIWHINFSRQSFESNGALFFFMLGVLFLLRFLRFKKDILWSSIFFAVSLYFYYHVRIIIPSVLLAFLITYRKNVFTNFRTVLIACFIGISVLVPILPSMLSNGGFARISTVSVVNDTLYIQKQDKYSRIIADNDTLYNRILYNRRIALIQTMIDNYIKNLSPRYIFLDGTGPLGLLFLFELPFFLFGFFVLFRIQSSIKWIFIVWFLSTLVVGALTTDQPNPLRTLPNAPMFALLSGLGFVGILDFIKNYNYKIAFTIFIGVVFLISFIQFARIYFVSYPRQNSLHFGDGYKQIVKYLMMHQENYERIYISGFYWRPYIFTLFWSKYDPSTYQNVGSKDHFGKYYFGKAMWDKEGIFYGDKDVNFYQLSQGQHALFMLSPSEFSAHEDSLRKIAIIDGKYVKEVFIAAELKNISL